MNLVWFKITDLRLKDHSALFNACKGKKKTLLVFFIDPRFFESMKFGHIKFDIYKQKFMYESLINLYNNIKDNNGHLNIYFEKPEIKIPELVEKYEVKNIYHITDTADEELKIIKKLKNKLTDIKIIDTWDNTLFNLEDINFNPSKFPDVFTYFRKSVNINKIREPLEFNTKKLKRSINDIENINIVKEENNKLNIKTNFKGGEDIAWDRLNYYFFEKKLLSVYKKTRNGLLGMDYSSKFSPYLAFGNISARSIFDMIKKYEKTVEKNDSTYWLYFELLWRDYFKFLSIKHGNNIFKLTGIKNKKINWRPNDENTNLLFKKMERR